MWVHYMGSLYYEKTIEKSGFLCTTDWTLEDIKERNLRIVLFELDRNSYYAETCLSRIGLSVSAYASNSASLIGRSFRGRKIYAFEELVNEKDVYFIVTARQSKMNNRRWQLFVHNIKNCGIFANINSHLFSEEDVDLHQAIMKGINFISFENETLGSALPLMSNVSGAQDDRLGIVNALIYSTTWSHYAYLWLKQELDNKCRSRILEIGPGYGLLAFTFLELFPDIEFDLLQWGRSDDSLSFQSEEDHALEKVQKLFYERASISRGIIELDDCVDSKKYDYIIMTEVFEHFALNPLPTIRRIKSLLNESGKIFLTTPNWGALNIYSSLHDMPAFQDVSFDQYRSLAHGHVYQYSRSELDEIFDIAELKVEKYATSDSDNHNYMLSIAN